MSVRYTGDISFLKDGMRTWINHYNATHSDDIEAYSMDESDTWGSGASHNFYQMHLKVVGLVFQSYPTVQLYNLVYPSLPA